MKHFASSEYWKRYDSLPDEVQKRADGCFAMLKHDPKHLGLHLKKVGRYWSVRIGRQYRALGTEVEHGLLWFWIGTHAEYDQLLR